MNRLFDDVFSRFDSGVPSLFGRSSGWPDGSWLSGSWPSLEVNASDKEVEALVDLDALGRLPIRPRRNASHGNRRFAPSLAHLGGLECWAGETH